VIAALDLLATLPGRRVAVLGEMLELGDDAAEAHRRVGRHAGSIVGRLVVVGPGASGVADGARDAGLARRSIVSVADREAASQALSALVRPGDVVLVKASRGAELDLLVDPLAELGRALGSRS
jgi:UDP-N-acetylmuramoyl-tripeptide--D-alanyl-D-alanine ligase